MLYEDLGSPTPRRKAGRTVLATLLLLAAGLGGGAYWVVGTPHYSLYRLQQAIAHHDVAAFEAGFDTASVVGQLVDELAAEVQQEAGRASNASRPGSTLWEHAGRQMALGFMNLVVEGVKPRLKELATQAVEERLKQAILGLPPAGSSLEGGRSQAGGQAAPGASEGQPSPALPAPQAMGGGVPAAVAEAQAFQLESLVVEGKKATAVVVRREPAQRLGLVLLQQADRSWRVVALDTATLRDLKAPLPKP